LQTLTKSGALKSVAGTHGGYKLARDSRQITALEVIRAIDGPIVLTSCFTQHGGCDQSERCTVREPLRHVHEAILSILQKITIHQLTGGTTPECEKESDKNSRHPLISESALALPVI
jgi:Rrf2 family protein